MKLKNLFYYLATAGTIAATTLTLSQYNQPSQNIRITEPGEAELEGIVKDSKKYRSEIEELFANPSKRSAERVQYMSLELFWNIFLNFQKIPEPIINQQLTDYISQSTLCLEGLKRITNCPSARKYEHLIAKRMGVADSILTNGFDNVIIIPLNQTYLERIAK